MRYLFLLFLFLLFNLTLTLFDTILVGNTTYLSLRIGQFQKITLPFNFRTYYSVNLGKTQHQQQSNNNLLSTSICQVEQKQFDLSEIDFLLISKQAGYKDIVTEYSQLVEKRFLVDMMAMEEGGLLYLVYTDSVKVVELDLGNNGVGRIVKEFVLERSIVSGKLMRVSNSTLYFLGPDVLYQISKTSVQLLQGYTSIIDFQSSVILNQNSFLIASRRTGILIYTKSILNTVTHVTTLDQNYFGEVLDIADIATDAHGRIVYVLTRQGSILQIDFDLSTPFQSQKKTHLLNRSGCQNMEFANDRLYVTCPQLHIIRFNGQDIIDKTFQNPNFNPRNIVFFNNIIILVGHNLAKIYYNNTEIGYYHDFLMRKIIPIDNKILIGNDYGISLTSWNISQLQIICGLKRKGVTQKYQGKMATTIDVIAQCNEQYFLINNITYEQELKNDICLYHFPISVDFWVGKEIDYLPFKVGVGVIVIVCVGVLGAWFVMNGKVKRLSEAIKEYSMLVTGEKDKKGDYMDMVEESDGRKEKSEEDAERELHEIGD